MNHRPEHFEAIFNHLESFSDDWDGYGAKQLFPESINSAKKFLSLLDEKLFDKCSFEISPDGEGWIILLFQTENQRVMFSFENNLIHWSSQDWNTDFEFFEDDFPFSGDEIPEHMQKELNKFLI